MEKKGVTTKTSLAEKTAISGGIFVVYLLDPHIYIVCLIK